MFKVAFFRQLSRLPAIAMALLLASACDAKAPETQQRPQRNAGSAIGMPVFRQILHDGPPVEENATVNLRSVQLGESVAGAHHISLTGSLGGKGVLILDPNTCDVNEFGDPVPPCTKRAVDPHDVLIQLVNTADPAELGRRLYRINGGGIEGELYLMHSPTENAFRLIHVSNRGAQQEPASIRPSDRQPVRRVVTLESISTDRR